MPGPDPRMYAPDRRKKRMGPKTFVGGEGGKKEVIRGGKPPKATPPQPIAPGKQNKFLSGGQSKLDKNKNNKIDAEDFALLRKEKKSKDPKVMKAKRGMLTDDFVKRRKKLMGLKDFAKGKGLPAPLGLGRGKGMGNFPAIKTAPGSVASQAEVKQGTKKLGRALRAAKATRLGKIILPVAAAGVAAQQYLKSKMKKKKEEPKKKEMPKRRMGGGMMKRYNKGGGADTGTAGEARSKRGVAVNKLNRAVKTIEKVGTRHAIKKFVNRVKGQIRDASKTQMMGGGMMQRPMGMAKKGKMIKARGGGMAKTKPTAMY